MPTPREAAARRWAAAAAGLGSVARTRIPGRRGRKGRRREARWTVGEAVAAAPQAWSGWTVAPCPGRRLPPGACIGKAAVVAGTPGMPGFDKVVARIAGFVGARTGSIGVVGRGTGTGTGGSDPPWWDFEGWAVGKVGKFEGKV